VKIRECEFRFVNRPFMPRMEMLEWNKEIEKCNYVYLDYQGR